MKNLAHEVRSDGSHHMSVNYSMASLYLVHMSEAHQRQSIESKTMWAALANASAASPRYAVGEKFGA